MSRSLLTAPSVIRRMIGIVFCGPLTNASAATIKGSRMFVPPSASIRASHCSASIWFALVACLMGKEKESWLYPTISK